MFVNRRTFFFRSPQKEYREGRGRSGGAGLPVDTFIRRLRGLSGDTEPGFAEKVAPCCAATRRLFRRTVSADVCRTLFALGVPGSPLLFRPEKKKKNGKGSQPNGRPRLRLRRFPPVPLRLPPL